MWAISSRSLSLHCCLCSRVPGISRAVVPVCFAVPPTELAVYSQPPDTSMGPGGVAESGLQLRMPHSGGCAVGVYCTAPSRAVLPFFVAPSAGVSAFPCPQRFDDPAAAAVTVSSCCQQDSGWRGRSRHAAQAAASGRLPPPGGGVRSDQGWPARGWQRGSWHWLPATAVCSGRC